MHRVMDREETPRENARSRAVIKVLIALVTGVAVLGIYLLGFTDSSAAECDFISYWSAGYLLAHGQNPYDATAVRALELKEGLAPTSLTLVMRNPPLALPMAWPLGQIGAKAGVIAWTFFLIATLIWVSRLLWVMNGRPDSLLNLLGFGFPPIVACLMARQTGILLLLGITLFLYLREDRPFLAGASLWLCALKPHYFVPFGIALFLWSLTNKKGYRILAGFGLVLAGSCGLAYAMDPNAWAQYSELIRTGGPLNDIVPSWSAQLRLVANPHAVWIQFLLEAAACVLTIWYFWTRRHEWDWADHGFVLLLIGPIVAPYGFVYDESMLLPAVLAGAFLCMNSQRPLWPLAIPIVAGLGELQFGAEIISRAYLWTSPAWLCWYMYATGRLSRSQRLIRDRKRHSAATGEAPAG